MPWYYKVCVGILVAALVLLAMYSDAQKSTGTPSPIHGVPSIHAEDLGTTQMGMDQLLDDNEYIYVLDEFKGIIRVFDLAGEYQFSWMFYDYLNGAFRMAVTNNSLYVCDPHNDLYVFRDGAFTDFIDREDALEILKTINFEANSIHYEIRLGSIWRISDQTCLIGRPINSIVLQRRTALLVVLGMVVMIAIVRIRGFQKKRQ